MIKIKRNHESFRTFFQSCRAHLQEELKGLPFTKTAEEQAEEFLDTMYESLDLFLLHWICTEEESILESIDIKTEDEEEREWLLMDWLSHCFFNLLNDEYQKSVNRQLLA